MELVVVVLKLAVLLAIVDLAVERVTGVPVLAKLRDAGKALLVRLGLLAASK